MKQKPAGRHAAAGFSLLELVVVIVLMGVLAAMAAPRLMNNDSQARAMATQLLGSLRQAQRMAATHNRDVCVVVAAGSVRFTMAASAGTGVACTATALGTVDDSSDTLDVTLTSPSMSFTSTGNFRFTPKGNLATNTGAAIPILQTITLRNSGANFARFDIQLDNGYVQATDF